MIVKSHSKDLLIKHSPPKSLSSVDDLVVADAGESAILQKWTGDNCGQALTIPTCSVDAENTPIESLVVENLATSAWQTALYSAEAGNSVCANIR